MQIKTVSYGFTRPNGIFSNEKLMVEIALNDTDDEQKALKLAKEVADKFFYDNNPHLKVGEVYQQTQKEVHHEIEPITNVADERMVILIENAGSVEELAKYKPKLNAETLPNYTKKLKELTIKLTTND